MKLSVWVVFSISIIKTCSTQVPTFEYGDCIEHGVSYTYGKTVICYWIDYLTNLVGYHCGIYSYAWIPDSGANYIVKKLAERRGGLVDYHIGYKINYTTPTNYTVSTSDGLVQSYSNLQSQLNTNNQCVVFRDGTWVDIGCNSNYEAICSYSMNFSYGDCKSNGVGYFDGSNLFCYWIDENLGPSHDACNGDFSVIESLDAQRVVNWLIKIEKINTTGGIYYIGYEESSTITPVITHYSVEQQWTYWKTGEPNSIDENCVAMEAPYGFWIDHSCTFPRCAICSTMTKTLSCPEPNAFENSNISSITGYLYSDTTTYTCNVGYEFIGIGNMTRKCQADGIWDGQPPDCQEINCTAPVVLPNSTVTCPSYLLDDVCVYTCSYGYEVTNGSVTRTCNADGSWDGVPLVCTAISCHPPSIFEFSTISCSNGYIFGSVCTFTCDPGYKHNYGELSIACTIDGVWSSYSPICSAVDCYPPYEGIKAAVDCLNGTTYGAVCIYTCFVGYELVNGTLHTTCQADGHWDGSKPICSEIITDSSFTSESISTPQDFTTSLQHTSLHTTESSTYSDQSTPQGLMTTENVIPTLAENYVTTYIPEMTTDTCYCPCVLSANTTFDIPERLQELQKMLTVDKATLSSTIRARISADDPRPSAAYIGYTGVIIIIVAFSVVVLFDILNVYQIYTAKRANNALGV